MAESLKNKTVKGVFWSSVDRFSGQAIHFVVLLVLARLLSPKDYGLIGMLVVFIAIAQSLIDSGFSEALIRKKDRTEIDNSSVFYFNVVMSSFLYIILFIFAPYVAEFYNEPQLTNLMRVLCFVVIINSFGMVQRALYTAVVNFKTQAKATFSSATIAGICGICFALLGYGVWSLVFQQIIGAILMVFFLWFFSSWRPQLCFSMKSIRELFAFGSKMMISSLINTISGNIYQLVVGKIFSAVKLGHYSQAAHITQMPSANISRIMDRVTYPILCNLQDDDERLAFNYRKLLRMSVFVIFPMMCLLAALSVPLVEIVIGEKWHYAALLIVPLCFSWMWHPVHSINLNLLKVKGRSDLFLRLEIIKDTLGLIVLAVGIPFGLMVMCYLQILTSMIALTINTYYTGKLIRVGFFMQMRDLLPVLSMSLLMFLVVFLTTKIIVNQYIELILGVVIGFVLYFGGARLLHFKEVSYLQELINKDKK